MRYDETNGWIFGGEAHQWMTTEFWNASEHSSAYGNTWENWLAPGDSCNGFIIGLASLKSMETPGKEMIRYGTDGPDNLQDIW